MRAQAAADPLSNPILLFALDLTLRMDRGEIELQGLEELVQRLTMEAFGDRAQRLAHYLGETEVAANDQNITELIEREARKGGFEEFRAAVARGILGWCSLRIRRFRSPRSWRIAWPKWRPGKRLRERHSIGGSR